MTQHKPVYPVRDIERVTYFWNDWYVKAIDAVGVLWHFGPWKSWTAAGYMADILRRRNAATTVEQPATMEPQ